MDLIKRFGVAIVVVITICAFIKPALSALIIGIILFYIGCAGVFFLYKMSKKGINGIGHILEYQTDGEGYKTPIIEFTTVTGEIIREEPYVYSSTDLSKVRSYRNLKHQDIPILYDPDNPKKFILRNEKGLNNFFLIIVILAGLFFIGFSIGWLSGYIKVG